MPKSSLLSTETLEPISAEGNDIEAPNNIIPNASAGLSIVTKMRNSHMKRAFTYARIQGMIDGNPPFSTHSRKRSGLLAQSNVNFRDGESVTESVALTYWSLFNDVQYIARFDTTIGDPTENPFFGDVVSEEFDRIVRSWDQFEPLMSQHQADLVKFGSNVIVWPDEQDWRFDVIDVWRVLVPERTRNHADFFGLVGIEHFYSAQELWSIYEEDKTGKWNKEILAQVLWDAARYSQRKQYSGQQFAELQRSIRNGDLSVEATYNEDIMLVSLFAREYDGKVSRMMLYPKLTLSDWLYKSDRKYSRMTEAVLTFSFTPGETFFHGNKGIGHRIFNTIEGITQVDNSLMDAVRRSSTVLVRTRAGRGRDLKQIQFIHGGFVDIGEADFIQNLMGGNLSSNVQANQYFRSRMENNNNISGAFMSSPDGKPKTLGEIRFQATREARVQKNRVAHYYRGLDSLLREIVRKMLLSKPGYAGHELVKLWKDRCLKRGVPEEFFALNKENEGQNGLPEHLEVTAVRASGSGSQVADQIETQSMMQIMPGLPGERGKLNVLKDFIAANRGYRYIDRYLPQEDIEQQPTSEDTIASIENNQLEKGEMVIVSPDNSHAVHAPRHIQRMQQIAESFNQSASAARDAGSQTPEKDAGEYGQYSLEEVDVAFQTLGPHFVRHLLYLSRDPMRKSLVNSLTSQWAILANFGDKIANNAQEFRQKQLRDYQKQQQQLSQLDMEERVKMRDVEVNANIKMAKLKADIERGATRDQLQYLIQRQRVSNENEIKRQKAVADIATQHAIAVNKQLLDYHAAQQDAQAEVTGRNPNELY